MRGNRFRRTPIALLGGGLAVALAATVVAVSAQPSAAADLIVQAEAYAAQSGAVVEPTVDAGGGSDVGYLSRGDWLRYDGVDLGPDGAMSISVRVASATGGPGAIELRTGSATGALLARFTITATGGWQTWTTQTVSVATHPAGAQTLYAIITNDTGGADFVNLNWLKFSTGTPAGWVDVDPVKWGAQLAAFRAMVMAPAPANSVRIPEFNATCTYTHSKKDDPIVFPGLPGASHMHTFLGNASTDAYSTVDSLLANTSTTCAPAPADLSAYWIPTLYEHGTAIEPRSVVVYYGSRLTDPSQTVPFPLGFKMIAGDARSQVPTPSGTVNQFYCVGGTTGGQIGRSTDGNWPVCSPGGTLMFQLVFPDCWDGRHLDSPDHKSHLAYTPDGTCPAGFPVAIPSVSFVIAYPAVGGPDGFTLASGMASSMHGDFFNAWDNDALGHRVKNCIVQSAKCNTAGQF